MLKIQYSSLCENSYYYLIANRKMQKFKNITFESYYNKYVKRKLSNYTLREILCGDFQKLLEIQNSIGSKYKSKSNIIKQLFNYDKKSKSFKANTSLFQPKISEFIEQNIEVHSCYFCNIEYINKFETSKGEIKNSFTLDHMIDKATYPFLALSLYNLIPSCYTCNTKVKGKEEIKKISPSDEKFDFNDKVKFRTFLNNKNLQIEKNNDFELLLKEDFSNKYDEYIKTLELDSRYKYHKDKVIEMINKRRDYPDSRIKELSDLTKKTQEEIKQDLFGIYLNEDLHKRPLSKLTKDIAEELKLI
ncbi:hypothetical protein [Sulfurimonas sp.]|uniref:hypothetical protein n=1 Tax=Sulfurimonas sp. TaxID=2022749 RepID=UPI003563C4C9